jgi:hypothetical protein
MPRRERSFAQEVEDRITAGDAVDEDAARVAVANDIATGWLRCRCNFEEATYGPARSSRSGFGIELPVEFRPARRKPRQIWNLWPQIRAGNINGDPVEYSPDNKTITAGSLRIVDIVVFDRSGTTALSTAKRVAPVRSGFPARRVARKIATASRPHDAPASAKRRPGDTDKDRGELLYQAAKPHTGSLSWSTDTAFAAAQKMFPDNPLLAETSPRTRRRAWLYAKQKPQEES